MWRLHFVLIVLSLALSERARGANSTLHYEFDTSKTPTGEAVDTKEVVTTVTRRLIVGGVKNAKVEPDGKNRISIDFAPADDKLVERAKRLLNSSGNLEFRVLASSEDPRHDGAIALAQAQRPDKVPQYVRNGSGKVVAEWVNMSNRVRPKPGATIVRKQDNGAKEALVVIDEFNVSGKYVTKASTIATPYGAAVEFEVSAEGAKLFERLTGENLPMADGTTSILAIVLDDEILSTAAVRGKISDRGQITGNFTTDEADYLADLLKSGSLPVKLKLVSDSP